jgi:hypothetical protein
MSDEPIQLSKRRADALPDFDPWDTAPSESLAEATLEQVIAYAKARVGQGEPELTSIAIRIAPPGFRAIMGSIAHGHRISYSRLCRYCLDHGIAILDAQEVVLTLRGAWDVTSSAAMEKGDPTALARLNITASYEFQRSQTFRTSLAITKETDARMGDLAMICGIPTSRMAVIAILVSLRTLNDRRGYQQGIYDEINAFYKFAELRRQVLLLGDGTSSPKGKLR